MAHEPSEEKVISLILDVETTGLDPHEDRIVEMGFVLTDWKIIYGALKTYINPERGFDNAYNKLNSKIVADAPTFGACLSFTYMLLLFADEYIAHNAKFDLAFMREELARHSLHLPRRNIFDTMRATGGRSLQDACRIAGVYTEDVNWHSALDDAVACFRLAKAIRGDEPEMGKPQEAVAIVPRLS